MFRKQNQKRLILLSAILLALLLVLLTVILVVKEVTDNGNQENGIVISNLSTSAVQKITYEYQGETVVLGKENGMWMLEGEANFPLNQTRLINTSKLCMTWQIAHLTFTRKVADSCENPATFGLDQPLLKLTMETKEKDQTVTRVLRVGIQYANSGYYCMLEGDSALYLIVQTS